MGDSVPGGNNFPNTGTLVGGHAASGSDQHNAINSTLSTQIIIKVDDTPIGALQRLAVSQNRPLQRIQEIGTDGVVEIVPIGATTFELTADRIVFDQLRLPEAFKRGFRFINAQRLPFDILVIDFSATDPDADVDGTGHVAMTYRNCWFTRYDTPYAADNYIITETASIWCETAFISFPTEAGNNSIPNAGGLRGVEPQTDGASIEPAVNWGHRRGSMDASGLVKSVFGS